MNKNQESYFETIKCEDFEVFNLEYHKKRISKTVGVNFNLQEYIYPPSTKLLKCKVTYTQNEIINIKYDEYIKKDIKSFKLVYDDNILYSKKSINRHDINNLNLQKKDCDEIIIIKNNLITDTSIANIAIYYNNQWLCTKKPLLEGTTMKRLINDGILKENNITVDMLKKSSKIALMNAMIDFDIITNFKLKDSNDK